MNELKQDERYTYADYVTWDDDKRYELIGGIVYMAPAPSQAHQTVSSELHGQLWQFLKGKTCKVYHAPFDVCLHAGGDDEDTVVQPDLLVVCDRSKLDGKGCNGAPDMIIEILSPSSASRDCIVKYQQYLNVGVREYWIVDPDSKTIQTHILSNGKYIGSTYSADCVVPVSVLDGCTISLPDVFAE